MIRACLLILIIVFVLFSSSSAGSFSEIDGYNQSTLQVFDGYYHHWKAERLAYLRQQVNWAVWNGAPQYAVGLLNEIIQIEPHDYYAWSFLSYTYAVLGDPISAANVDLDFVTYFEFIPPAIPAVNWAMYRLQIWEPYGWQQRVAAKRANLIPYVPFQIVDNFIESVKAELPSNRRREAHFAIEEIITSRKECVEFIEIWENGRLSQQSAKRQIESSEVCRTAYIAISEY